MTNPVRLRLVLLMAVIGVTGAMRAALAQDPAAQIRRVEDSLLPRVLIAGEAVATRTLAVAYGWPDFVPPEKTVAVVDPASYAALAGTYRVEGRNLEAVIAAEGGRLYVSGTGIPRMELLPESETVFFSREDGTPFTFVRQNGTVVALTAMGLRAEKVR